MEEKPVDRPICPPVQIGLRRNPLINLKNFHKLKLLAEGMATSESSFKNRFHFFNFRAIMYLFARDVAYLIQKEI